MREGGITPPPKFRGGVMGKEREDIRLYHPTEAGDVGSRVFNNVTTDEIKALEKKGWHDGSPKTTNKKSDAGKFWDKKKDKK